MFRPRGLHKCWPLIQWFLNHPVAPVHPGLKSWFLDVQSSALTNWSRAPEMCMFLILCANSVTTSAGRTRSSPFRFSGPGDQRAMFMYWPWRALYHIALYSGRLLVGGVGVGVFFFPPFIIFSCFFILFHCLFVCLFVLFVFSGTDNRCSLCFQALSCTQSQALNYRHTHTHTHARTHARTHTESHALNYSFRH